MPLNHLAASQAGAVLQPLTCFSKPALSYFCKTKLRLTSPQVLLALFCKVLQLPRLGAALHRLAAPHPQCNVELPSRAKECRHVMQTCGRGPAALQAHWRVPTPAGRTTSATPHLSERLAGVGLPLLASAAQRLLPLR